MLKLIYMSTITSFINSIRSISFIIAISIDVLALLIAYFILISDAMKGRSGSNDNFLMLTLGFTIWVGICFALRYFGMKAISGAMAWLPAIPILGYALFILMFIILKPDMK